MSNEQKAMEIANKDRTIELLMPCNPSYYDGLLQGAMEMAKWKDEQFAVLLRTELATWQGNSAEAKYRREMLKELLNQFK